MTTTDGPDPVTPRTVGGRVLGRVNDWVVAPGASRGELAATYTAALAGSMFAAGLGLNAGFSTVTLIVIALVAFDVFGGAVANATPVVKRRFHGPGHGPMSHFAFVSTHVVQPAALAVVVPGFGWTAAATIYAMVLIGSIAVLVTPRALQRPVAVAMTVFGSTIALSALAVPVALLWFAPVLFIKLLLGHLLPEEAGR